MNYWILFLKSLTCPVKFSMLKLCFCKFKFKQFDQKQNFCCISPFSFTLSFKNSSISLYYKRDKLFYCTSIVLACAKLILLRITTIKISISIKPLINNVSTAVLDMYIYICRRYFFVYILYFNCQKKMHRIGTNFA